MNIGPTSPDYAKYMLKWFTIWQIYSKIYSTPCPISRHHVTTFEVDGTASNIDNEYPNNFCHVHMIFTWSNKIAKFYSKDWISRSCHSNAFFEKNILWIKKDKKTQMSTKASMWTVAVLLFCMNLPRFLSRY